MICDKKKYIQEKMCIDFRFKGCLADWMLKFDRLKYDMYQEGGREHIEFLLVGYLYYLRLRDCGVNSIRHKKIFHGGCHIDYGVVLQNVMTGLWHLRPYLDCKEVNTIGMLIKDFFVDYLLHSRWVVRPEFAFLVAWFGDIEWVLNYRNCFIISKHGIDDLWRVLEMSNKNKTIRPLFGLLKSDECSINCWESIVYPVYLDYCPYCESDVFQSGVTGSVFVEFVAKNEIKLIEQLSFLLEWGRKGDRDRKRCQDELGHKSS